MFVERDFEVRLLEVRVAAQVQPSVQSRDNILDYEDCLISAGRDSLLQIRGLRQITELRLLLLR